MNIHRTIQVLYIDSYCEACRLRFVEKGSLGRCLSWQKPRFTLIRLMKMTSFENCNYNSKLTE